MATRYENYAKLEADSNLIDVLRFLIDDQAFQKEFIVTLILDYYHNNKKKAT